MYIPKGTKISYRIIKAKNDEGIEQEMILVDKEIFESMIVSLGFEKKEYKECEEQ